MSASVIIAAAGSGTRMKRSFVPGAEHEEDKQYIMVGGMPVLAKTIGIFEDIEEIGSICVVIREGTEERFREEIAERYGFKKLLPPVFGGKERADSVRNGLDALPDDTDIVLIHDGARPFASEKLVRRVMSTALEHGAAVPGLGINDTVKVVKMPGDDEGYVLVESTPDRSTLRSIQTPQGFKIDVIREAYRTAEKDGFSGTDDASVAEHAGFKTAVVEGERRNIKITTQEDLESIPADLANRGSVRSAVCEDLDEFLERFSETGSEFRNGTGYDVHRFVHGRPLILGGINVPHNRGLEGHSDADVLVHAIMDSMLGAAGLGDIGTYFPDTDPEYEGISSLKLLKNVSGIVTDAGFSIINVDSTIIAQRPKLMPYVEQMRNNIAETLGIEYERVGVKATTTEKLGFTGREEGIAAMASATLRK